MSRSPSSRRAWIEITVKVCQNGTVEVALLAEGVDRNLVGSRQFFHKFRSPSSRRAWIEIPAFCGLGNALVSRPPRGGRG